MKRMPKYHKWIQQVNIPIMFIMTLLIALLIFSQMIMETSAYSFIITKNNEINEENTRAALEIYFQRLNQEHAEKKLQDKILKEKIKKQKKGNFTARLQLKKPIQGGITTSVFGDGKDRSRCHKGHDWAVAVGTKVKASAKGTVSRAYLSSSYGYNIVLEHTGGVQTRYAHLSKILVEEGENVDAEQIIGLSGNTGDSTGPHLHFEVIKNGIHVNPATYLSE